MVIAHWEVAPRNDEGEYTPHVIVPNAGLLTLELAEALRLSHEQEWYRYRGEGARMYYFDIERTEDSVLLYRRVQALMEAVNDEHWGFDLWAFEQEVRVNRYLSPTGAFPPHNDHSYKDASKLALVQLLNDDFEGGDLTVGGVKLQLNAGDAVLFPAYAVHSVGPVLGGTRYTLTAWASGPRYQ